MWGDCQGLLEVDWAYCGRRCGKIQDWMVVGGFPRGVSRPKTRGAAGPERVWPRDFLGGSIFHCAQHSGTAHVHAAQWYSTCVCSTVVQHLCVQYRSGTVLVCAVQWYSTYVCSTVVQHLCVGQWYSTRACITRVQQLCVQYSGTALVCSVRNNIHKF